MRVGRPDNPLAFGGLDDLQLPTGGSVPFTIQPPSGQPDGVPLGGAAEAPAAGVSAPIRVPTPAPVAEALTPPSAALPGPSVAAGHPQAASAPQPLIPRPFVYLLIGDRVWQDDNANGQQDAGEPGVAGAAVELLSGGAPVATTTTDAGGAYQFSGVEDTMEGTVYGPVYRGQTYQVHFVVPAGYSLTTQAASGVPANLDSDANQTTGVTGDVSPIEHQPGGGNPLPDLPTDCGLVPSGIKIEYWDGLDAVKIGELKIGRMDNAFNSKVAGAASGTLKPDFIENDDNRFLVNVTDPAANADPTSAEWITVTIKTGFDTGNTINLLETGINNGVFRSAALLLTSFAQDDEEPQQFPAPNTQDNAPGDRTFLSHLDDQVTTTYKGQTGQISVPSKQMLNIRFTQVRATAGGQDPWAANVVTGVYSWIQRVFAPSQILILNPATLPTESKDPPAGVVLTDGLLPNGFASNKIVMSAEAKPILDSYLRKGNTAELQAKDYVHIFLVPGFQRPSQNLGGQAMSPVYLQPADAKYADAVFLDASINLSKEVYRVLAHEITHLLLNTSASGGHVDATLGTNAVRLMAAPMDFWSPNPDSIYTARRLTGGEVTTMTTTRADLLKLV